MLETKSTEKMDELTEEEQIKIKCAIRHFAALGIHTNTTSLYHAPVTRFNPDTLQEEEVPYGDMPLAMGFFATRVNFGATLQEATSKPES